MFYIQATFDVIGRILDRDATVKTMISDVYDSLLTMFKMKNFANVMDSDTNIESVESNKRQLERKQFQIVVAGKKRSGVKEANGQFSILFNIVKLNNYFE